MNKYNYLNASKILSCDSLYFGRAIMIMWIHLNTHPINESSTEKGKFLDHWEHLVTPGGTIVVVLPICFRVTSETHSILRRRWLIKSLESINTMRPRQNGRHFPDDIFKCISLNESVWISIKISLKFVSKGPINNSLSLVQIMVWRQPGDKPLS